MTTEILGAMGLPRDDMMYHKWDSEDEKTFTWQVILPRGCVTEVLNELHGSLTGEHFGKTKMLEKVRERFYWDESRTNVER